MEVNIRKEIKKNETIDIGNLLFEMRGIDSSYIDKLRNPNKANLLSPFDLDDMVKGVKIFLSEKFIAKPPKIFIQVDSDVDGLTSAALMYHFCKMIYGTDVEINWNMHATKMHGINLKVIPDGTDLVIIPDAGSNQYKDQQYLNDKGIYVIILDHHAITDGTQPPSFEKVALINNQLSERYQNKSLSGVGVAYKFCEAVTEQVNMDLDEEDEINIDYLMDLVAVGLIADSMLTTVPENAYYIKTGLNNINNEGLMALVKIQAYSLKNRVDLNIIDISFYIAPLINAVFRVGRQDDRDILFKAFAEGNIMVKSSKRGANPEATEIASVQAARHASNTKKRQTTALNKALVLVENQIRQKVIDNPNFMQESKGLFIVLDDNSFPKSMTGLIAIKLLMKYNKPTFVLMRNKIGYISGSSRTMEYAHIPNFREFCHLSENTDFAAGHPCAFGIGFNTDEDLDGFREELEIKSAGHDFVPMINIDFYIHAKAITKQIIFDLANFADLYGKGFEEPKLGIHSVNIPAKDFLIMGADKSTVKFFLNGVSCIRFKDSKFVEIIEEGLENQLDITLSFVGRSSINEWMGNQTPQIIIENFLSLETDFSF